MSHLSMRVFKAGGIYVVFYVYKGDTKQKMQNEPQKKCRPRDPFKKHSTRGTNPAWRKVLGEFLQQGKISNKFPGKKNGKNHKQGGRGPGQGAVLFPLLGQLGFKTPKEQWEEGLKLIPKSKRSGENAPFSISLHAPAESGFQVVIITARGLQTLARVWACAQKDPIFPLFPGKCGKEGNPARFPGITTLSRKGGSVCD
ncbi:hypothetical protein GWK47_049808 [Chionoecetes opilio]|uniref:Uncharacterized protein n=1 Tax=Chionoecetes opilio TaxID=41210 RepID=A0A8J4Y3Q9_CHIOP|nr:hypothetical protein GWK47_049808 [Chionoecetes opilio]